MENEKYGGGLFKGVVCPVKKAGVGVLIYILNKTFTLSFTERKLRSSGTEDVLGSERRMASSTYRWMCGCGRGKSVRWNVDDCNLLVV